MITMYNPKTKVTVKNVDIKFVKRWMEVGFHIVLRTNGNIIKLAG